MDKQEATSTLISHVDTSIVTREQLAALPAVVPTATFKPVAHIDLVTKLEQTLGNHGFLIGTYADGPRKGQLRENYALRRDGSCLFGTLDLTTQADMIGTCASLGIRTANDKTMSLQMVAGMRIFVCDNMAFNGDMVPMKRKHTSGLDLMMELEAAVTRYEHHYFNLKMGVDRLKGMSLTDDRAKAIILDAIFKYEALPQRFGKAVMDEYFEPQHDDFAPRTAWSLHNAFTEVIKQIKAKKDGVSALPNQMEASRLVGKVFELFGQKA